MLQFFNLVILKRDSVFSFKYASETSVWKPNSTIWNVTLLKFFCLMFSYFYNMLVPLHYLLKKTLTFISEVKTKRIVLITLYGYSQDNL